MATTYSVTPNPASVNEDAGTLTFIVTRFGTEAPFVGTTRTEWFANKGDCADLLSQTSSFGSGQISRAVRVSINSDAAIDSYKKSKSWKVFEMPNHRISLGEVLQCLCPIVLR